MKLKEGIILAHDGDDYIALVNQPGKNAMIRLNETGYFFFEQLKSETSEAAILEKLLEAYDLSPEKAEAELNRFLERLRDLDVLEG